MKKALGGVLFIDEAYELMVKDGQNTFNNDALAVILRYMEDHRSELVVIAAGYRQEDIHGLLQLFCEACFNVFFDNLHGRTLVRCDTVVTGKYHLLECITYQAAVAAICCVSLCIRMRSVILCCSELDEDTDADAYMESILKRQHERIQRERERAEKKRLQEHKKEVQRKRSQYSNMYCRAELEQINKLNRLMKDLEKELSVIESYISVADIMGKVDGPVSSSSSEHGGYTGPFPLFTSPWHIFCL